MALNRSAEASAITAMRLVACTRFQESHALNEKPTTTQSAAARMTAALIRLGDCRICTGKAVND
jgi:hypothetical protein